MVFGLLVMNRVYNLARVCPDQGMVSVNFALVLDRVLK